MTLKSDSFNKINCLVNRFEIYFRLLSNDWHYHSSHNFSSFIGYELNFNSTDQFYLKKSASELLRLFVSVIRVIINFA